MSSYKERCPNCFGEAPGTPCRHCGWSEGAVTTPPYLPVGTLLDGRYRIGRVLGHGGFGITYLGWDENLHLKLAIKEYLPRDFGTRTGDGTTVSVYAGEAQQWFEHGLERFQDEARTLAKFQQHPGIVSVYNFFRANGTGYMVMEYVEGVTLKAYLEAKGPIPYETARKALLPVMDALRAVHAEGLLHRDVAPDNIYITRQKQVKLLDFGAARFAVGEHSRSLSVILKPGYAPEEQYRAKGRQGPWTDVYGMAATFYHCITGQVPPEALDRLEEDTLQPPSRLGVEMPLEAREMLMAGLAVRANGRPQSMEAFQQPFLARAGAAPTPRPAQSQFGPAWSVAPAELASAAANPFATAPEPPAQPPPTQSQAAVPLAPRPPRLAPRPRVAESEAPARSNSTAMFGWAVAVVVLVLFGIFLMRKDEPEVASAPTGLTARPLAAPESPLSEETASEPIDPAAQFWLGWRYFQGDGRAQSDTEAFKWFRKAAEQGNVEAEFKLGFMYSEGRGVPKNHVEAVKWYRKAAEQGDAVAQNNLGNMYDLGRGVPQNDTEAARWYRKAAEQGLDAAQFALGVMYANGEGVPQNDAEALRWYRKAAEQGYAKAQFQLADFYETGRQVPRNDREAVSWYLKAAVQGHAVAQNNLGLVYAEGRGVAANDREAEKWYREALRGGDESVRQTTLRNLRNLGVR